jgi:hypothetical protein
VTRLSSKRGSEISVLVSPLLLLSLVLAGGCAPEAEGQERDPADAALRVAIDRLKSEVAATPTDERTVAERAQVLADWVDAYALAGGEVGLGGPAVRLHATLPPHGEEALDAGREIDRLVREFTLREEPGALGELSVESLGPFEARSYATIRQTWTAGTRSMSAGGGFWIARHFNANFGAFQTSDPKGDGYVTLETSDGDAVFAVDSIMASGAHAGFRAPEPALVFRLRRGEVDAGESVTIVYGDRRGGGRGLLMPSTSNERMPLPLYVDLDGSGEWRPLPLQPFVVEGSVVAGVHGFGPSIVEPGEPFELSVRAEDRFRNRATGEIPAFEVLVDGVVRATTPAGKAISVVELRLREAGVHHIILRSAGGAKVRGDANPVWVVDRPRHRIFWGETHGHSGQAEGIGTIDSYLRFARDDARLDFVTHSEHDTGLDAGEWAQMRAAAAAFDDPGRFIPFLGWEWTRPARVGGHHNVLFRALGDQELVSSLEFPALSLLYRELHRRHARDEVLVIPHAHMPGDYRQSDSALENLVEMSSMHGTFEWFMKAYLAHGHQVGVVAASDDHLSHPGYSAPNKNSLAQRGGLGAVLAKKRVRDAIFDALKERSTYATTGERIILDFRLNGVEMGQRTPFATSREITGRVIGTAPIESVELIKNGEPIWQREFGLDTSGSGRSTQLQLSFYSDETPLHPGDAPRGWRHWRGNLAVEGARLDAIEATDFVNPTTQSLERRGNGASFATNTRGETSSLRLMLSSVGPDAAVVLELEDAAETGSAPPFFRPQALIRGGRTRLALVDLENGRLERRMPIEDYATDSIALRRVSGDGPRDLEFVYTDDDDPRQGDYYYVRVKQADDARAWSTPIWVGGYPSR